MNLFVRGSEVERRVSRPVFARSVIAAEASPAELSRVEQLEERIAELEATISEAERDLPSLIAQARGEGSEAALAERSDAEAKRLALIQQMAGSALERLDDRLRIVEAMSPLIANAVLKRLFGDDKLHPRLVRDRLKQELSRIRSQVVIGIRVSGDDFDVEHISLLAANLAPLKLDRDDQLASGECVIDCQLGHIDLGLEAGSLAVSTFLDTAFEEARC